MISPYADLSEAQGLYDEETLRAAIQSGMPSVPADKKSAMNMVKAVRSTPEWQQQAQGIDQLQHLINLDAQNNAKKMSVDLSPLGAYFDYQNAQRGAPTNIAKSLAAEPIQQTPLRDLAELQRRRGDMTKELTTLISKSGGGSTLGQDRLEGVNFSRVLGEKHKMFDNSDKALGALNTLVRELGEQIPSDLNRLQIQRAMADMNGMRPALAEVMMESGNQSLFNKLQQVIDKNFTKGSQVSDTDIKEFWESARSSLNAIKTDRRIRAEQLKSIAEGYHVPSEKLKKIIHQRYIDFGSTSDLENMPAEPPKKGSHGAAPAPKDNPKPSSADDLWDEVSK